ncbi:mitochondrial carrier [Paramyrothecium foliicola]|nr:mitochondrial carrier [Paramyrothecium foliicola]
MRTTALASTVSYYLADSSEGPVGTINYLLRADAERLPLIPGDADTFQDVLSLMTEYEDVLERQESLAASLGAKLTGPRLLKGIDRFFDGPIKTYPVQPAPGPITWLDIVRFAKTNAAEFVLTALPDGSRRCRMPIKGFQVEILEDDWRLISSGALDRFSQERPFDDDETAELATLDILEQRTAVLYKRADEVAARARLLHHKLGHRKHDIARRRGTAEGASSSTFRTDSPAQRGTGPDQPYDLHADLLSQFLAPRFSQIASGYTPGGPVSPALSSSHSSMHPSRSSIASRASVSSGIDFNMQLAADPGEAFRALVTRKTDRLPKGAVISPPCDRCRRLRTECVKHLTACQGCTKKHARCSWKAVTEDEVAALQRDMGMAPYGDVDMNPGQHGRVGSVYRGDLSPRSRPMDYQPRLGSEGDISMGGMYTPGSTMNRPSVQSMVNGPRDPPSHSVRRLSSSHPLHIIDIALEPETMAQQQPRLVGGRDDRPFQHAHAPAEHAALIQSRETGVLTPDETVATGKQTKALPFAKSWVHMMAGGVGGMTAATLTAPLDVLKTRLQSDFYQAQLRAARAAAAQTQAVAQLNPARAAIHHLNDTLSILATVYRTEGWRALFKGLGPNLVGVVPARSINFFVYGNGKRLMSDHWNGGEEAPWVHISAGIVAGVATSTATNPIWMVKTRLQLDKNVSERSRGVMQRQYRNSLDCVRQILRDEGMRGLYKGMSASYLGVAESTLQWTLYEQLKASLARREARIIASGREKTWWDRTVDWTGKFGAAGGAKLIAAVLAYPHEVARTRLRQAPLADGKLKYTGLWQCFSLVWKEEGLMGLYGGLTPHLLRTVPSAAIMFGMYEGILRLFHTPA